MRAAKNLSGISKCILTSKESYFKTEKPDTESIQYLAFLCPLTQKRVLRAIKKGLKSPLPIL